MPRLNKTRLGDGIQLGDVNATEVLRADTLPDTFDPATLPGAIHAIVRLPNRMPTPLKLQTVGDIEQIKSDGVKAYAIMVYIEDGNGWKLRHRSERDLTVLPSDGKPDVMLGCSLDLGPTKDSPLSGKRALAIMQVVGGVANIGIDVESG